MSLRIVVVRSRLSIQPLRDPSKPPAWDNNDGNNSLDLLTLYDGTFPPAGEGNAVFSCRAQTVANLEGLYPGAHYHDTITPGSFQLRAFVDPRNFYGRIHGLCNCRTINGDEIGPDSIIPTNSNRWLMHDWQSHRDKPPGQDTRVAWSAGCFVVPDKDLVTFGEILDAHGMKPGDLIDGILELEV